MSVAARRLIAVLAVVTAMMAMFVATRPGAAQAAPASCEYPAAMCACPTLSVSTTLPEPGGTLSVTGADFVSGRRITLVLKPVRESDAATSLAASNRSYALRSVRTSSAGTFATTVTMPRGAIGRFDLAAVNGTPRGAVTAAGIACPADPTTRLRIDGDNIDRQRTVDNETSTAFTGFNILWFLLAAAVLVAIGVWVNRRGKRSEVRSIHG